jgi:hypothetical protein
MDKIRFKFLNIDKPKVQEVVEPNPIMPWTQDRWEQHRRDITRFYSNGTRLRAIMEDDSSPLLPTTEPKWLTNWHTDKVKFKELMKNPKIIAFMVTCLIPLGLIFLPNLVSRFLFYMIKYLPQIGWFLKGPIGTPESFGGFWVNGLMQLMVLSVFGLLGAMFYVGVLKSTYKKLIRKFE